MNLKEEQALEVINKYFRNNGQREITGEVSNHVAKTLLYALNSSTQNENLNDLINSKANKDASSLSDEDKNKWKEALNIANLQFDDKAISITNTYSSFGLNIGDKQNKFNDKIYEKVNSITGENFANTDLQVTENRKHTGTGTVEFGMPLIYSNANQKFSNLPDRFADANYNQLAVFNNEGILTKSNNIFFALKNTASRMSDAQKLELRTILNGGFTSNTMSVFAINPFVLPKKDETNYIILQGANLNLNPNSFKVEVLDKNLNLYKEIKNNQVSLSSNTELSFYDNFKDYEEGEYRIRLTNGVASYLAPASFYVNSVIDNINLQDNAWQTISIDESKYRILNTSTHLENDFKAGATTGVTTSALSSPLFDKNDDFVIELSYNQSLPTNSTNLLRIGITEEKTLSNVDTNIASAVFNNRATFTSSIDGKSQNSANVGENLRIQFIKRNNILSLVISSSKGTISSSMVYNASNPIRLKANFGSWAEAQLKVQLNIVKAYKF